MQIDDDQWISPSFNTYSLNQLSQIAAKVAAEVAREPQLSLHAIAENDEQDDFEFSLMLNNEFEASGDEIISASPIFPIFNRDLIENREEKLDVIKIPLRRLFIDEESSSSSSSEVEADEIESIPPGSYCVWKPKVASPPCRKSKSTGFGSKRWKLRDLLRRSNSDGKDSFVFLTPKKKEEKSGISKAAKALLSSKKSPEVVEPPRRLIYSPANRDIMRGSETPNRNGEMPKRKSYLPYRQDLFGFFTTVNSLGRNFSTFKMK